MRKKFFLISMMAIVVLIVSVIVLAEKDNNQKNSELFHAAKKTEENEKTVIAIVNGKEIYKETIDFLAEGEEVSKQNSALVTGETPEAVDKDKILQTQIRNMVVFSEAERLGLSAGLAEAEEYTKQNYELLKQIGGQTYQAILDYMSAMQMSEEEYLVKAAESNRIMLTRANLYDKFVEGKSGTNEELTAEYEKYVQALIEKADIEYMN